MSVSGVAGAGGTYQPPERPPLNPFTQLQQELTTYFDNPTAENFLTVRNLVGTLEEDYPQLAQTFGQLASELERYSVDTQNIISLEQEGGRMGEIEKLGNRQNDTRMRIEALVRQLP